MPGGEALQTELSTAQSSGRLRPHTGRLLAGRQARLPKEIKLPSPAGCASARSIPLPPLPVAIQATYRRTLVATNTGSVWSRLRKYVDSAVEKSTSSPLSFDSVQSPELATAKVA